MTSKIGILTGGGDAPGLNAVIRAVVKTAYNHGGYEVIGFRDGFDGFLNQHGEIELTPDAVRGILPRGGTILGTANRGNPFARKVVRDGEEVIEDMSAQVVERINSFGLQSLIVVGGDGTMKISVELFQLGCPMVGVPKTIDNDINGTDVTFGHDTAVSIATEAIDRLHTTAEAHHRVMVLELMGRDAGFIALRAGVSGGADVILIPEIPFEIDGVVETILKRVSAGRHFSIVAVAEGAYPEGGQQTYKQLADPSYGGRLGGVAQIVGRYIEDESGLETRVTVLGHLQRGGSPTSFDRWLATRFGAGAFRLAHAEGFGRMVGLRGTKIIDVSMESALVEPKRVDLEGDAVQTARGLDIFLGRELD